MIINSLFEALKKKKNTIVCDWDNTIQETEYFLLKTVFEISEKTKQTYLETYQNFLTKPMDRFLEEDSLYAYRTLLLEEKGAKEYERKLTSSFEQNKTFYTQAPVFKLAQELLELLKKKRIKKLIFLTHTPSSFISPERRKIQKLLDLGFSKFKKKISFVHLPYHKSKGAWIHDCVPSMDFFIDDNLWVLEDFVKQNYCKGKSLICPIQNLNRSAPERLNKKELLFSGINIYFITSKINRCSSEGRANDC